MELKVWYRRQEPYHSSLRSDSCDSNMHNKYSASTFLIRNSLDAQSDDVWTESQKALYWFHKNHEIIRNESQKKFKLTSVVE